MVEVASSPTPMQLLNSELCIRRFRIRSVARVGFFLSLALTIAEFTLLTILVVVLQYLGVIGSINDLLEDLTVTSTDPGFRLYDYFTLPSTLMVAGVLLAINAFFLTLFSSLMAGLYNTVARLFGGIVVSLAERRK